MSLIDNSQQKILMLNQKKEEILALKHELPDAPYHIFSINAMIRDAELRYERLKTSYSPLKCSQCLGPIKESDHSVTLGHHIICYRCLKTISQVMNTKEMEERRSMKIGTVKTDCNNILHSLKSTSLIRKSGKCWLVHEVLLELFYDAGRSKSHFELTWIDEMEKHLQLLQTQYRIINDIKDSLVGATWQLLSLDAQIRDYENRLSLIKGGTHPFQCTQCNGWIKEPGLPILLGHFTLCNRCKHTIEQVITTSEAETRHSLTPGQIRKDIHRGQLGGYIEMGLLRQSGSIWLLHESVIQHHYLKQQEKTPSAVKPIPQSLLDRSAAVFKQTQKERKL
ncbi:hypothetical protein [Paenibacillus polymyxa]|uniref:hypothetical protein n=1 Tax=Paenibacillus polymyxa TaxID=1406 RepID=UPI0032178C65